MPETDTFAPGTEHYSGDSVVAPEPVPDRLVDYARPEILAGQDYDARLIEPTVNAANENETNDNVPEDPLLARLEETTQLTGWYQNGVRSGGFVFDGQRVRSAADGVEWVGFDAATLAQLGEGDSAVVRLPDHTEETAENVKTVVTFLVRDPDNSVRYEQYERLQIKTDEDRAAMPIAPDSTETSARAAWWYGMRTEVVAATEQNNDVQSATIAKVSTEQARQVDISSAEDSGTEFRGEVLTLTVEDGEQSLENAQMRTIEFVSPLAQSAAALERLPVLVIENDEPVILSVRSGDMQPVPETARTIAPAETAPAGPTKASSASRGELLTRDIPNTKEGTRSEMTEKSAASPQAPAREPVFITPERSMRAPVIAKIPQDTDPDTDIESVIQALLNEEPLEALFEERDEPQVREEPVVAAPVIQQKTDVVEASRTLVADRPQKIVDPIRVERSAIEKRAPAPTVTSRKPVERQRTRGGRMDGSGRPTMERPYEPDIETTIEKIVNDNAKEIIVDPTERIVSEKGFTPAEAEKKERETLGAEGLQSRGPGSDQPFDDRAKSRYRPVARRDGIELQIAA